jgi:hypothetical protein
MMMMMMMMMMVYSKIMQRNKSTQYFVRDSAFSIHSELCTSVFMSLLLYVYILYYFMFQNSVCIMDQNIMGSHL